MVPACQPRSIDELRAAVMHPAAKSVLAFGGGRSYGDNAINSAGAAIATGALNRVVSFDHTTGELICEAGACYRELLDDFLRDGFVVPVSPGTGFATIGGAIANDVHGKNHDKEGSLGGHVNWIELVCADGSLLRASAIENPDIFHATVGGIGLTGIIARASITMKQLGGNSMLVRERRMADLDEFIGQLSIARQSSSYSVGWIDALKRGSALGRGVLETAEPAGQFIEQGPRRSGPGMPFDLPAKVMNRYSIGAFNAAYFRRVPRSGRERIMTYDRFTYPLDAIRNWNRMYGSRGFYQFQCVLPDEAAARGLRALLETVADSGAASFLAVLKTLGPAGQGYLSFPVRGYTLALDIPRSRGSDELLRAMEEITLDHDGRVYLAKDAMLSRQAFQRMYPKYPEFRAVLDLIDPGGRFQSDMARRLGITKNG
ncbi:MAG: FAD-binding protein [Woeseiaceae bacterium]